MKVHSIANPETSEGLKEAFAVFDRDGSGKISSRELKQAMSSLGEKLNDDEIAEMIKEADKNGDGEIDYEGKWIS